MAFAGNGKNDKIRKHVEGGRRSSTAISIKVAVSVQTYVCSGRQEIIQVPSITIANVQIENEAVAAEMERLSQENSEAEGGIILISVVPFIYALREGGRGLIAATKITLATCTTHGKNSGKKAVASPYSVTIPRSCKIERAGMAVRSALANGSGVRRSYEAACISILRTVRGRSQVVLKAIETAGRGLTAPRHFIAVGHRGLWGYQVRR